MKGCPRVSVAMITRNEESHLQTLLPQLRWAAEVIVVDDGSTDATREVASQHGCVVIKRRLDSFAQQRNHALAAASGDWVLSLDADERPTHALWPELKRVLPKTVHHGFHVPIRSCIFGRRFRFSGTQDDRPVRLFRRGRGQWQGDVHEVLHVRGTIGRLSSWLDHQTLPDVQAFLAKMGRYTSLQAKERSLRCQPVSPWQLWTRPAKEVFRRLIWKRGLLDGPQGWAFCLLSGLSELVCAHKQMRLRWMAAPSRARADG